MSGHTTRATPRDPLTPGQPWALHALHHHEWQDGADRTGERTTGGHDAGVVLPSTVPFRPAPAEMQSPSRVDRLSTRGSTPTGTPAPLTAHGTTARPLRDILIIEDDSELRAVLSEALSDEGYSLEAAADGAAGLSSLQQGRYRVLLLDLLLPHLDGLHVLRTLRSEPALRPPAIIVLSALHHSADVLRALESGADDFLTKPFDLDDLTLRVSMWLRRSSSGTAHVPPGLRVHTLGRFYVEQAGQICLHQGSRARKATTLFKYLLTHQERTVPTAEILDVLWPETNEELASMALRSLLYQLRRQVGAAGQASCLIRTNTALALQLGLSDWWDVAEFEAWLAEGAHWQRAGETTRALDAYAAGVALYAGDYLEEDIQAGWAGPLRERLRDAWLHALQAMAHLHGQRGEHAEQESLLRHVLRADAYREQGYRDLMALLAAQGRSAEALVLYRRLEELLRAEFAASPDPETQALARSIGWVDKP